MSGIRFLDFNIDVNVLFILFVSFKIYFLYLLLGRFCNKLFFFSFKNDFILLIVV